MDETGICNKRKSTFKRSIEFEKVVILIFRFQWEENCNWITVYWHWETSSWEKVKFWSPLAHSCRSFSRFLLHQTARAFLLPQDGMLVHRRSLPCNLLGFPNNSPVPIYTPGWREALWELIKCLAQEHNTIRRRGNQLCGHRASTLSDI